MVCCCALGFRRFYLLRFRFFLAVFLDLWACFRRIQLHKSICVLGCALALPIPTQYTETVLALVRNDVGSIASQLQNPQLLFYEPLSEPQAREPRAKPEPRRGASAAANTLKNGELGFRVFRVFSGFAITSSDWDKEIAINLKSLVKSHAEPRSARRFFQKLGNTFWETTFQKSQLQSLYFCFY